MRVNQQSTLSKLSGPRVRVFLVRFWRAAQAVLPRT
jgi:hypothetical protein